MCIVRGAGTAWIQRRRWVGWAPPDAAVLPIARNAAQGGPGPPDDRPALGE